MRYADRPQFTTRPIGQATGGVLGALQPATDACGDADELWLPIWQCGGPIDAPELIPTGHVRITDARRWFSFHWRD